MKVKQAIELLKQQDPEMELMMRWKALILAGTDSVGVCSYCEKPSDEPRDVVVLENNRLRNVK